MGASCLQFGGGRAGGGLAGGSGCHSSGRLSAHPAGGRGSGRGGEAEGDRGAGPGLGAGGRSGAGRAGGGGVGAYGGADDVGEPGRDVDHGLVDRPGAVQGRGGGVAPGRPEFEGGWRGRRADRDGARAAPFWRWRCWVELRVGGPRRRPLGGVGPRRAAERCEAAGAGAEGSGGHLCGRVPGRRCPGRGALERVRAGLHRQGPGRRGRRGSRGRVVAGLAQDEGAGGEGDRGGRGRVPRRQGRGRVVHPGGAGVGREGRPALGRAGERLGGAPVGGPVEPRWRGVDGDPGRGVVGGPGPGVPDHGGPDLRDDERGRHSGHVDRDELCEHAAVDQPGAEGRHL